MRREKMSRPSSSVPHQCSQEGGDRRVGRRMYAGSWGAIQGANTAKITKMMTNTAPVAASGLWRAARGSDMERVDTFWKSKLQQSSPYVSRRPRACRSPLNNAYASPAKYFRAAPRGWLFESRLSPQPRLHDQLPSAAPHCRKSGIGCRSCARQPAASLAGEPDLDAAASSFAQSLRPE